VAGAAVALGEAQAQPGGRSGDGQPVVAAPAQPAAAPAFIGGYAKGCGKGCGGIQIFMKTRTGKPITWCHTTSGHLANPKRPLRAEAGKVLGSSRYSYLP
jgi:hypothetical protein